MEEQDWANYAKYTEVPSMPVSAGPTGFPWEFRPGTEISTFLILLAALFVAVVLLGVNHHDFLEGEYKAGRRKRPEPYDPNRDGPLPPPF